MLFTLVKNNTKLLIRSKVGFIFMCLLPIALIFILTSAFSGYMGEKVEIESFSVGYSITSKSYTKDYFDVLKKEFEGQGMFLTLMDKEEGIKALASDKIVSYIVLGDELCTIYNKEGIDIKAMIFESSLQAGMAPLDGFKIVRNYTAERQMNLDVQRSFQWDELSKRSRLSLIKREKLAADPVPKAKDYYGIVQIIFIIWFGVSSAVTLSTIERKNKILARISLTNVRPITLFLGKFIPNSISTSIQVGIAIIVSTLLLKVNWGEYPALSFGLLLMQVMAVSAFGTMLTVMIKNSTIITLFMYMGAFTFGFIGGSFQTYMYNFIDERIVRLSPLYYMNRTLVELSTKGESAYLMTTFIMLLIIIIVSVSIGLSLMYIRREE